MSEAQIIKTDSGSHQRNAARVAREEAELQELLKQAGVIQDEDNEDSVQQEATEEATEAEPSGAEPVEPEVQPESNPEQEAPEKKAEASEDDDTELSAEEKSFKKRYSDIRRHMQEKDKEYKAELEKLKAQLNAATKNELVLPKSTEEVEAWAKKYPDIAGIVEAIADKKASERASDLDSRLKEIEELRVSAKREKAEAELMSLHPDFNEIRQDNAFHSWADSQPKWVQDALYENEDDAKSVARVLDLYKVDKGIKTQKRSSEDKDAASSVKAKKAAPATDDSSNYLRESQVAKMSIKEYEKRAEEIFEAQRKGKFIYDLSKK
jgi:hypothetical protein